MRKILFVTNRNIINTCGELRLIKNRAEVLYKKYHITTDFFVYTHKKIIKPETINAGGKIKVYSYSNTNIIQKQAMSYRIKKDIQDKILKKEYQFIILSGAAILSFIEVIRAIDENILVFADSHGAFEELIEFPGKNVGATIARHIYYKQVKKFEKQYLPKFDYIMAVSEELKRYLIKEYGLCGDRINVIPCAIERFDLDFEKTKLSRKRAREKYGIKDDEQVFVYSGGTSKWQCIEESVKIFRSLCAKNSMQNCKLLLLSGNLAGITKYEGEDIIVDSLSGEEVFEILPAGDFAFLLRDDYITNKVAYPNKFLEYISAGLKIITTPYVEDIARTVKKYNLGYVLSQMQYESKLAVYCKSQYGLFGDDFTVRQKLINDVSFENRMAFFTEL
nr:glycosyltransferase [uncultured Schaedlerella sp.]